MYDEKTIREIEFDISTPPVKASSMIMDIELIFNTRTKEWIQKNGPWRKLKKEDIIKINGV